MLDNTTVNLSNIDEIRQCFPRMEKRHIIEVINDVLEREDDVAIELEDGQIDGDNHQEIDNHMEMEVHMFLYF